MALHYSRYLTFISGLQNDHKALMHEIEEGLHQVHAASKNSHEESMETEPADLTRLVPFASVDLVDEGSPAHVAVSIKRKNA
jgi:26S proteasome non-ATPase regulatory subunit 9